VGKYLDGSAKIVSTVRIKPVNKRNTIYKAKALLLLKQGMKPAKVQEEVGGDIKTIYWYNYQRKKIEKKINAALDQLLLWEEEIIKKNKQTKWQKTWTRMSGFFNKIF
jgi:hypothetical protein